MSRLRWVFSSSSSSVRIFSNSAMTAGHDRTNGACCELLGVTERGDARPTHYHDITHQLRAPAFIYMLAFTEQLTHVYASINPFNPRPHRRSSSRQRRSPGGWRPHDPSALVWEGTGARSVRAEVSNSQRYPVVAVQVSSQTIPFTNDTFVRTIPLQLFF